MRKKKNKDLIDIMFREQIDNPGEIDEGLLELIKKLADN
jgi:hypothetical protein